jgi:lipopolysaccharide cholinephosphotransferase
MSKSGTKIESLDEIKKIELDIMISFDRFCKEHDIKYSLAYGTMLGAIRHKGFIPWDDDIDILMVREEYDKFIELCRNGERLDNENYKVNIPLDSEYMQTFVKITDNSTVVSEDNLINKFEYGVWIDIFPIDYVGNTYDEALKVMKYMTVNCKKIIRTSIWRKNTDIRSFLKNIVYGLYKLVYGDYRKYVRNVVEYNFPKNTSLCSSAVWCAYLCKDDYFKEIYPAKLFREYTDVIFENREFMMFSDFDDILKIQFGDYMKIPDEKDRIYHHMQAYYK